MSELTVFEKVHREIGWNEGFNFAAGLLRSSIKVCDGDPQHALDSYITALTVSPELNPYRAEAMEALEAQAVEGVS